MPQAVLPVRAFQQLDVRSREPLQGGNADGRIPGATFLPEVRFLPEVQQSSRVSLATIHAQMAMGNAGQRAAAAGATAALITAGGASGGGSAIVERRSRQ